MGKYSFPKRIELESPTKIRNPVGYATWLYDITFFVLYDIIFYFFWRTSTLYCFWIFRKNIIKIGLINKLGVREININKLEWELKIRLTIEEIGEEIDMNELILYDLSIISNSFIRIKLEIKTLQGEIEFYLTGIVEL